MLKNKNNVLFLCYSAIFVSLFFLFLNQKFSNQMVLNYRLLFSANEISTVIKGIENRSFDKKLSTPDDPGFLILYAITSHFEGDNKVDVTSNPEKFPVSFKVIYLLLHLGIIYLFIVTSSKLITLFSKILALLFLLSPNLLAVFWGMDVYLFPLYAIIISFYATGELQAGSLSRLKMFLCSILIGISEVFRKKSILFFLPVIALLGIRKTISLKSKMTFLVIFLASTFFVNGMVGLVFNKHGHEVWHSLHAGLFEYGGCVGNKGEAYPYFIYEKEDLANKSLVYCQDRWNDNIQYRIAEQNNIQTLFSTQYNELLKDQIVEILKSYPTKVISLIVMRMFNALSFIPLKEHSPPGAVLDFDLFNLLESILFLTIFGLWFYVEKDNERKWLFTSILIFTLPGPLLIHSGHIIYNMPLNFIEVLIIGEFISLYYGLKKYPPKIK